MGSAVQFFRPVGRAHVENKASVPLEKLIEDTSSGCRTSFDEVYVRTSRVSYSILMAMLRNQDDAKDALQEVYVRVWTKAHLFKTTGSNPIAWIKVIARNTAIDILRTRKRTDLHDEYQDVHEDDRGLSHHDRLTLSQCLEKLDPVRIDLVKMVYIEGATYNEVAVKTNTPINTVKSWLRRSILQLKYCISGEKT